MCVFCQQFSASMFYNKNYSPRWVAPHDAEDRDIEVQNQDSDCDEDPSNDLDDFPDENIQSVEPVITLVNGNVCI